MITTTRLRIEGTWYNELGSRLVLVVDEDGRLSGTFSSGVGNGDEEPPVTGFVDRRPHDGTTVLGFVVGWPATHSVTVWSGQCDLDRQVIETTWLLSGEVGTTEEWHSTLVGHNRFTREGPDGGSPGV